MTGMLTRPRRLTRTRRRALVTLHVALSVGWLGGSMVMLTLAIAARASQPAAGTRSAYWAMHLLADVLLIPLSLSVLLIGVLVAATTPWGLLRYRCYARDRRWVVPMSGRMSDRILNSAPTARLSGKAESGLLQRGRSHRRAQSRSQIAVSHRARSLKVARGSSSSEQVLDQFPSSGTIDYLRSAMVTLCALPERDDRLEAGRFPASSSTTHAAPSYADVCMTPRFRLTSVRRGPWSSCTATI